MGKREVVQAIASVGVRVPRLVFRDEGEYLGESAVTVAVDAFRDSRVSNTIEKVSDEKLGGVLAGGAGRASGKATSRPLPRTNSAITGQKWLWHVCSTNRAWPQAK